MGGIELMNTLQEKFSHGEYQQYKNSTFVLSTAQGDTHVQKLMVHGFTDICKKFLIYEEIVDKPIDIKKLERII